MSRYSVAEQDEARKALSTYLPAGSTVYLSLQSVSRSGASRTIKCLAVLPNSSEIHEISWYVSRLLGLTLTDYPFRGVRVSGGGMDMGLALADQLSHALYGKPVDQSKSWNPEDASGGVKFRWL